MEKNNGGASEIKTEQTQNNLQKQNTPELAKLKTNSEVEVSVNKDLETKEWKNYRDIAYYSLLGSYSLKPEVFCFLNGKSLYCINYLAFTFSLIHRISLKRGKFCDINEIVAELIADYFGAVCGELTEQQIELKYGLTWKKLKHEMENKFLYLQPAFMEKKISEAVSDAKDRKKLLELFCSSATETAASLGDQNYYAINKPLLIKYRNLLKDSLVDAFNLAKPNQSINKTFKFDAKRLNLYDMLGTQGVVAMVLGHNFTDKFIGIRNKDHYRVKYFQFDEKNDGSKDVQGRGPEMGSQLSKYYILYFFRPNYLFSDEKPDPEIVKFYVALNSILTDDQKSNLKIILNADEKISLQENCDALSKLLGFDNINNEKNGVVPESYLSTDESGKISSLVRKKEIFVTMQQKKQLEEKLKLVSENKITSEQRDELKKLLFELSVQQDLRNKILKNKDDFRGKIVKSWENQFKTNSDYYHDYILHQDYGESSLYNKLYQCVEATNFGKYKREDFIFDLSGKIIGARPLSCANVFDFAIQQIKNGKWKLINGTDKDIENIFSKKSHDEQRKILIDRLCCSDKIETDDEKIITLSEEQLKTVAIADAREKENLVAQVLSENIIPEYESKKQFIGQIQFDFKGICKTEDVVFNEDGTVYYVKQDRLPEILGLDKKRKAEFEARNKSLAENYGAKVDINYDDSGDKNFDDKSDKKLDINQQALEQLKETLNEKCTNVQDNSQYENMFIEWQTDFYLEQNVSFSFWEERCIDFALKHKTDKLVEHCRRQFQFYKTHIYALPDTWSKSLLDWLKKNHTDLYNQYEKLNDDHDRYNQLRDIDSKIRDRIEHLSNKASKSVESLEDIEKNLRIQNISDDDSSTGSNTDERINYSNNNSDNMAQDVALVQEQSEQRTINTIDEMEMNVESSVKNLLASYKSLGKYKDLNVEQKKDFLVFIKNLHDSDYAKRLYTSMSVPYKYWDNDTKSAAHLKLQLKWFFIGCLFLGGLISSFFIPGLYALFAIATVEINILSLAAFIGSCAIIYKGIKNQQDFNYSQDDYLKNLQDQIDKNNGDKNVIQEDNTKNLHTKIVISSNSDIVSGATKNVIKKSETKQADNSSKDNIDNTKAMLLSMIPKTPTLNSKIKTDINK